MEAVLTYYTDQIQRLEAEYKTMPKIPETVTGSLRKLEVEANIRIARRWSSRAEAVLSKPAVN